MQVSQRFDQLLANLRLTDSQQSDGQTKHTGVRSCLNVHYYSWNSGTANSSLTGSWGKSTEIRPPRDIDILFTLPKAIFDRYQLTYGNKQSQLLQEVKRVLQRTYSNTDMRGDGQVVWVPFTSYAVEVCPAFAIDNGRYWICNTNDGGSYKIFDPNAEYDNIKASNDDTKGNTRDLIRMLKRWQEYCSVPMKSFWLELLAIDFLRTWAHRGKSTVYYDWLMRDFFHWLESKGQGAYTTVTVPGTYETIYIGKDWSSKAESAKGRAEKATEHESQNMPYSAGEEWQKIFGDFIPTG